MTADVVGGVSVFIAKYLYSSILSLGMPDNVKRRILEDTT